MGKIIVAWQESRRRIARGAKRRSPGQNRQSLIPNAARACNNTNGLRMLLIPSLIGALIAPLCILTTHAAAIPASSSPIECWAATAPPANFYIAAILSPGAGCTDHYRWKLGVPAAGVAECWISTASPPAGFYIAAILGPSPSCPGHYRWKLGVAAAGVTDCWVTSVSAPPAGFYIAEAVTTAHAPGCLDHPGWKLGVPAAGVAECWVTTAPPPAGFYIAAILDPSPSCLGHYRWKLGVAAIPSPSPSPTPSPSPSPTLG
jgi:hypothetical protein